jgi:hypothetical protein
MKKIPTIFERDWKGNPGKVLDKPNMECMWVFAGEGVATRKLDGTSCMVRGNTLYKRRELRKGDAVPVTFEVADHDEETGKTVGWVLVGDGPEDRWHREAFAHLKQARLNWISNIDPNSAVPDGTYELVGPKVQGNPEHYAIHTLIKHDDTEQYIDAPRTFKELWYWMDCTDIEGLVWHHPDGRMAKLKLRDMDLKRVSVK